MRQCQPGRGALRPRSALPALVCLALSLLGWRDLGTPRGKGVCAARGPDWMHAADGSALDDIRVNHLAHDVNAGDGKVQRSDAMMLEDPVRINSLMLSKCCFGLVCKFKWQVQAGTAGFLTY